MIPSLSHPTVLHPTIHACFSNPTEAWMRRIYSVITISMAMKIQNTINKYLTNKKTKIFYNGNVVFQTVVWNHFDSWTDACGNVLHLHKGHDCFGHNIIRYYNLFVSLTMPSKQEMWSLILFMCPITLVFTTFKTLFMSLSWTKSQCHVSCWRRMGLAT